MTQVQPSLRHDIVEHLRLAGPVAVAQLSTIAMQVMDVAMVGRYGSVDLGGMGLGNALASTFLLISMGILTAVSPQVSQAEGAGDRPACGRAMGQGLWIALFLSIGMMVTMLFAQPLLEALGQERHLARLAQTFVIPLSLGFPGALGFIALRQFVEGLSLTRPAMYIALGGMVLNGVLNQVLIYGRLGLPALGVAGSGISTAIVNWLSLIALALYIWRSERFSPYHVSDVFHGPRWGEMKRILVIGVPIGVSFGLEVGAFAFTSVFMGWFGPQAIAAHQIALNVVSTTFMIPLGISIAGAVRVGQARGRGDLAAVQRAGWITFCLAGGFMVQSATVLLSIPGLLMSIYTRDPAVIEIGLLLLAVGAAFQTFDGIQVAGTGVLRGLKDTRIPMFANMLAYWGIGVPVGYLLGVRLGWGPAGLWWGLTCGLGTAGTAHLLRFRYLVRGAPLEEAGAASEPAH
jgi:MATE family multidrug resistance protein